MTSNDNGMIMPVAPTGFGGNNDGFGFGGGWWIILLLAVLGWGNGGFGWGGAGGGFGNMMLGYDFPWLMNGQQGINANTNAGFNQAATASALGDIQGAINTGFGNVQTSLCSGFAGVNANIANGFAQAEIAENGRQMANMNQMFGIQSALQNCCCENRAATADLKYTIASEECATRANSTQNTQGILNAINGGIQSIKDQLCQDKIDAKNDEIAQLRQELLYARGQASRDVQTAAIRAGQATTANQLIQEMRSCPVPSMPVYGMTPIFTCPQNQSSGCGCGCGNGSF